MRVRLDNVHTVKRRLRDGTIRIHHYHRVTREPLPGKPGSGEFQAAWQAAEDSLKKRPAPTATIGGLIDRFRDSADWRTLRESTRRIMTINLAAVHREYHDLPLGALEDRGVRAEFLQWRDRIAMETPRAADAKLAALQRVLSFGMDRGLITAHPLEHFRRVYKADRAEIIWLPEHVTAMEAAASPEITAAMLLALHTGQRQGDLLQLTWRAFDGKGLSFVQSKGRTRVYVPLTDAALELLRQLKETAGDCVTILRNPAGCPWSADAFKKAWRAAFRASRINEDLHFHDLRGTAVTMLAEAACTVPEICAITGHSLESATRILEVYLSRTRALATAAIIKLNEHDRNRNCKPPCKPAIPEGPKAGTK